MANLQTRHDGVQQALTSWMESLEPRLLLSADWNGDWAFDGYSLETERMADGFDHELYAQRDTLRFTETGQGEYAVDVLKEGVSFDMEDIGGMLAMEDQGYDGDGHYYLTSIRIIQINADVALFLYNQAAYETEALDTLWWTSAHVALVARESFATVSKPEWEGYYTLSTYDMDAYAAHTDDQGNPVDGAIDFDFETDLPVMLKAIDSSHYLGMELGGEIDDTDVSVYTVKKRQLDKVVKGAWSPDGEWGHSADYIRQGPDGTFYSLTLEYGFDGEDEEELWWVDASVSILEPKIIGDDATQYDENSAVFTNPYLGLSEIGDSYTLAGSYGWDDEDPAYYGIGGDAVLRTFALTGEETLGGVDCLILTMMVDGEDIEGQSYQFWLAQDSAGNLRLLRAASYDILYESKYFYRAMSPDEAALFMPGAPEVGQSFMQVEFGNNAASAWIEAVGQTVNIDLGSYEDCIVWGNAGMWNGSDRGVGGCMDYIFFAPGVGAVYAEWDQDEDLDFLVAGDLDLEWQRIDQAAHGIRGGQNWVGQWDFTGKEYEAGDGELDVSKSRLDIAIVPLPGGYYFAYDLDAIDEGVYLYGNGYGRLYSYASGNLWPDEQGHVVREILILPVDDNAAVFHYADSQYESSDSDLVVWADSTSGLMTRGSASVTPRPFEGEYAVQEWELSAPGDSGGGFDLTASDFALTIAPEGKQYLLDAGQDGLSLLMSYSGGALRQSVIGTVDKVGSYLYREDDSAGVSGYGRIDDNIYRGPNDTLYYFGNNSSWDPVTGQLDWSQSWVGILTPLGQSQYKADLTVDLDEDVAQIGMLQGDRRRVDLTLSNTGNALVSGRVDLELYASADGVLDVGDVMIGALGQTKIKLKAGSSRGYALQAAIPADFALGTYTLLVRVVADGLAELDTDNNLVAASTVLVVDEPQRDLVGEFDAISLGEAFLPGDKGTATFVLANQGNIPVRDRIDMSIYLSSDNALSGDDRLAGRLSNKKISFAAGGEKTYKVKLTVPADLTPGSYSLILAIDEGDAVAEVDELNNVVVAEDFGEMVWRFGAYTGGKSYKLTIPDGDAMVTFSLSGPGAGEVVSLGADGFTVALTDLGETARSSAKIVAKGGELRLAEVDVDGSLKLFNAGKAELKGDFTATGVVKKLILGDVTGQAGIVLHTDDGIALSAKDSVTAQFGVLQDVSLDTGGLPLKSVKAAAWINDDGVEDLIAAPWIGKMTITGRKARGDVAAESGDLEASLQLSGNPTGKPVLSSLSVAGNMNLSDGIWSMDGSVGKLAIKGIVRNAHLESTGSIAAFTAGAVIASDVLAGCRPIADIGRHPDSFLDFLIDESVRIKSIKVTGIKGEPAEARFVVDSNFAAPLIGSVKLVSVEFDNGGSDFGLYALDQGTGKEIKSVVYKDLADKSANWKWPVKKDPDWLAPDDFVIEIFAVVPVG